MKTRTEVYERIEVEVQGRRIRVQINEIAGIKLARVLELWDDGNWWDLPKRHWTQETISTTLPDLGDVRRGNE